MSRAGFLTLVGLALVVGAAFRVVDLDRRPMHHDEANQAVKVGALLETGAYQNDRVDQHGPTLNYLTLPVAWARGQRTLAALDEWTLRLVPAAFGVGLLALFAALRGRIGPVAAATAVVLGAVSPALVFYSRVYIQESIFACLAVACLIAMAHYWERPAALNAVAVGVCAGLAYATKETSVIVVPAAVAAVAIAHHWPGPGGRRLASRMMDERGGPPLAHVAAGAAAAVAVAFVFYSSFFTHPDGLVDSVRAFQVFVGRGTGESAHVQPWHYYLHVLGWWAAGGVVWTEAAVLALAVVGLVSAFGRAGTFWSRVIALYAVICTAAYSALAYKMPWNILPFYAAIVLLAGIGAQVFWSVLCWG